MSSFLSRTNTRADGYGGTLENRARLPLEVLAETRRAVEQKLRCRHPLSCRGMHRGAAPSRTRFFGVAFAQAGVHFIRCRAAASSMMPSNRPSAMLSTLYRPERLRVHAAIYLRRARAVRTERRADCCHSRAVREAGSQVPVVCAGGIHNFEMAEDYLARGVCDIVGAARQSLADPDWFRKIRARLRRRRTAVRVHQLLRGARPEAQAGHLPALGQLPSEAGERRTPDGKRRLTAPVWQPPDSAVSSQTFRKYYNPVSAKRLGERPAAAPPRPKWRRRHGTHGLSRRRVGCYQPARAAAASGLSSRHFAAIKRRP